MIAYELHPKQEFDALTRVERQPASLGPHDIRVRIRAVSLNYRDLNIARLAQRRPQGPKRIPTSDGAGEVVQVGSAVTRFRGGERVAALFFPDWIDGELTPAQHARALGGTMDGMLAEEVVLDERSWVTLPAHLSFEEGATLPCAGVTAWNALFESAHIGPGSTVLAQGTGGVSIFTLQLAKAAGARVILTSSSEAKRQRARELGAGHAIREEGQLRACAHRLADDVHLIGVGKAGRDEHLGARRMPALKRRGSKFGVAGGLL